MKYIITESQSHKMVINYLNNQFNQIETKNNIYFVSSEEDDYSPIRYDKNDGRCYINYGLINELSSFFPLEDSDSKQIIKKWVEDTLQVKVKIFVSSIGIIPIPEVRNT
jgi:hypothetical protein